MVERLPRVLLRVEGAALFAGAVVLYFHADYPWWLLLALALAPDLSMLGYLAGPRAGALAYDWVHTTLFPIVLAVAGVLAGSDVAIQLALIWLAHIGADHVFGYGLKYPTHFKETHLQRV